MGTHGDECRSCSETSEILDGKPVVVRQTVEQIGIPGLRAEFGFGETVGSVAYKGASAIT